VFAVFAGICALPITWYCRNLDRAL
jgi:hypothetical protein